tara:strand:+ start:3533 stop:3802 length:270 start_codon:yes stop_codon:yes gene_type:complete
MSEANKPIDDNIKKKVTKKDPDDKGANDAITFRDDQINYWKERAKDNKDKGGARKTSGTGARLNFGGSVLGNRTKRTYRKKKNRVVGKK